MPALFAARVIRNTRARKCGACGKEIARKRWCAFVASTGWVHLSCLVTPRPPAPPAAA